MISWFEVGEIHGGKWYYRRHFTRVRPLYNAMQSLLTKLEAWNDNRARSGQLSKLYNDLLDDLPEVALQLEDEGGSG